MEVKTKDWTTGNKEAPKANQRVKENVCEVELHFKQMEPDGGLTPSLHPATRAPCLLLFETGCDTHTHTKSVNIQLLNLPVEQTQPPNSTGFLFKLTCNVVEKGGVTPAPAACSLAYCSAAVTAVKVHRGLALASLASPANSHSRPASVSRSPFSTQS